MPFENSLVRCKLPVSLRARTSNSLDIARELCRVFPRIPRSVYHLTEAWISRHYNVNQKNTPVVHYAYQQVGLWLLDLQHKIQIQAFTQVLIEELFVSLWDLYVFIHKRAPEACYEFTKVYKTISVLLSEFAVQVALLNESPPTDFQKISNHLLKREESKPRQNVDADAKICPSVGHFHQERLLGAGGFGIIYKAKYMPGNMICVLKIVPVKSFSFLRHSVIDRVVAAVTDHPLVASYFCCFETSEMAIGAMEYIRGVTLECVVNFNRTLPPNLSRMLFVQIVSGLMHLHYSGFIYRDLKPSNVMVRIDGRIKLIDFETSRICRSHFSTNRITYDACQMYETNLQISFGHDHESSDFRSFFKSTILEFDDGEKAGTPPFQAPEVIDQQAYGRAADWWSMGIVLFKMHTGMLPYRSDDDNELRRMILERPVTFPKLSRGVKLIKEESLWKETNLLTGIIYALLEKDPSKRLGSNNYDEILANPFLASVNWEQPNYADVLISNVFEQKATQNERGEYSIQCSKELKKLNLVGLENLEDRENVSLPLSSYVSKFFRRLIEGRTTASRWHESKIPLWKVIRNSRGRFAEVEDDETPEEIEKLEVAVPKGIGLAAMAPIGIKVGSTVGENKQTYYFVRKLSGSAANSGLIVGDVILEVNGSSVVNQSRMEVERKLMFCTDLVFFTVMTSSPYRLCKSRRDISVVTNLYPSKSVTLSRFEQGIFERVLHPTQLRRIEVRPCGFYAEQKNGFVQLFSIWHVDPSFVEGVYFGDFLISIDGNSVSKMSEKEVNRLLNKNKEEKTITLIPMSCLRTNRPYFDRALGVYSRDQSSVTEDHSVAIEQMSKDFAGSQDSVGTSEAIQ